ncbi:uncharacterized protein LOC143046483 [Mytilus galloprovincialis]|uniref:uncharacterized protein LOC143046483 n=1 Tax=Mytilus galloprovincialis TaxID=29158 RepID=UPI003F7C4A79
MQINDVQPDEGICEKCSINEVKISVSNLCKNKRICSSPHTDDASSCLFHPRYARIHYLCQEEENGTLIFPESTTGPTITTDKLNSSALHYSTTMKERTTGIYVDNTHETSTVSVGTTVSLETRPVFQLDMQGRVLIYEPVENTTFTVCSNHWYAADANVLCKHLHKSSYGIVRKSPNHHLYKTVELKFQCTGNEISLFDCNSTFVDMDCNVSTVAAAICCTDDDSSECSSNTQPISNIMPSMGLNIGVVTGIVIGVLLIACVIIVIVVFIRR